MVQLYAKAACVEAKVFYLSWYSSECFSEILFSKNISIQILRSYKKLLCGNNFVLFSSCFLRVNFTYVPFKKFESDVHFNPHTQY